MQLVNDFSWTFSTLFFPVLSWLLPPSYTVCNTPHPRQAHTPAQQPQQNLESRQNQAPTAFLIRAKLAITVAVAPSQCPPLPTRAYTTQVDTTAAERFRLHPPHVHQMRSLRASLPPLRRHRGNRSHLLRPSSREFNPSDRTLAPQPLTHERLRPPLPHLSHILPSYLSSLPFSQSSKFSLANLLHSLH